MPKPQILSPQDMQSLLSAAEIRNFELYLFFETVIAGARPLEALNLVWDDISPETNQIGIFKQTNPLENRLIYISPAVMEKMLTAKARSESQYVFANPHTKQPYSREYISMFTKKLLQELNLQNVGLHSFRLYYWNQKMKNLA